jgi:hypothetical protein
LLAVSVAASFVGVAEAGSEKALGIAWQVKGQWRAEGQHDAIGTGEGIRPGSLLRPGMEGGPHSITVLLPDGQRVLYECYQAEDCARGFRVPSLYREPATHAADMLWRIHSVLTHKTAEQEPTGHGGAPLPREEVVAILDAQSQGQVAGLVASLPDGHYSYTEREFGKTAAPAIHQTFDKRGKVAVLNFPSAGLFDLVIADRLETPRVDLLVAAVKAPQSAKIESSFHDAKELLEDWNGDYQGWPIHDFQRAYLESIMLGIQAPPSRSLNASTDRKNLPGIVAEPAFTVKPGVMKTDTEVGLKCDTPGAEIHFTVDGSQPFVSSQAYRAPIVVKGTALTIKAFATAKDMKQSNVVTGIFRIGD